MPGSTPSAPVDCTQEPDISSIAGKTVIVTGGASGLGEAYTRALAKAGAAVFFGDRNVKAGEVLAAEIGATFAPCDVTVWEDQLRLFQLAATTSPTNKVHHVVANAGIIHDDDVFAYEDEPKKPNLDIINVNTYGVLYTVKLATHYFIKQNGSNPSPDQDDTSLVLIGSGAAFLDCPRGPQYSATKWAARGILHSLRRTAFYYGSRVNVLSPWYVRTKILSSEAFSHVESSGVQFATTDDAAEALLRLIGDKAINGRSLFISARKWAPRGYMDLDLDEYAGNALLEEIQADQIKSAPVEQGLFV